MTKNPRRPKIVFASQVNIFAGIQTSTQSNSLGLFRVEKELISKKASHSSSLIDQALGNLMLNAIIFGYARMLLKKATEYSNDDRLAGACHPPIAVLQTTPCRPTCLISGQKDRNGFFR